MISLIRIGGLSSPAMNVAPVKALQVPPFSDRALTFILVDSSVDLKMLSPCSLS